MTHGSGNIAGRVFPLLGSDGGLGIECGRPGHFLFLFAEIPGQDGSDDSQSQRADARETEQSQKPRGLERFHFGEMFKDRPLILSKRWIDRANGGTHAERNKIAETEIARRDPGQPTQTIGQISFILFDERGDNEAGGGEREYRHHDEHGNGMEKKGEHVEQAAEQQDREKPLMHAARA